MTDPGEVDVGGHLVATTGTVRTALHLLAHLCIGGSIASYMWHETSLRA